MIVSAAGRVRPRRIGINCVPWQKIIKFDHPRVCCSSLRLGDERSLDGGPYPMSLRHNG
jgi:hypothetical protein